MVNSKEIIKCDKFTILSNFTNAILIFYCCLYNYVVKEIIDNIKSLTKNLDKVLKLLAKYNKLKENLLDKKVRNKLHLQNETT